MAGLHLVFNLPAFLIVMLLTVILVLGIRESAWFNAAMVAVKMVIIVFFLVVGAFYVQPANWSPFAPNGFHGISMGAAIIFFAYIGFDAVSTAAEETRDPQRNMPIGILASLVVCTVLYIAVAVVLTGMVKTEQLGTAEPLATAFAARGIHWAAGIVAFGAVVATTSVLFVFQLGQPRILFCDGARPAAARLGRQGAPEIPHPARDHDSDRACWWRALRASATSTRWSSCATSGRCSRSCWWRRGSWCCGALIRTARARFGRRGCRGCRWGQSSPARWLMRELPVKTWMRFLGWLIAGLIIYFCYSFRRSRLNNHRTAREGAKDAKERPDEVDGLSGRQSGQGDAGRLVGVGSGASR